MNGNQLVIQAITIGSCVLNVLTEDKSICSKCVLKETFGCHSVLRFSAFATGIVPSKGFKVAMRSVTQ
jgi:hypothetical protein